MSDQENNEGLNQSPEPAAITSQPPAALPLLFDAMAEQTIPFEKRHKGKKYQVSHTFKAIGGEDGDAALLEYDRLRDVRMASESGDVNTRSDVFTAANWLWTDRKIKVTGWGPEDGSKVNEQDRADAISEYLACDIMDVPLAEVGEGDAPWDDEDTGTVIHTLRARFGERVTFHEHELAIPTKEQRKRYSQLMTRTKIGKGEKLGKQETKVPSKMKALCVLYAEMKKGATNYKDDIIPRNHRVEVIHTHMSGEMEVVEEK